MCHCHFFQILLLYTRKVENRQYNHKLNILAVFNLQLMKVATKIVKHEFLSISQTSLIMKLVDLFIWMYF